MNHKEIFVNKSKTLIINTDLAIILGDLNDAIVLNQLNYWLEINEKAENNYKDGCYWVFNTYTGWKNNDFPYWSEKTIQRIFTRLEKKGVVKSANYNKYSFDKTKWYTIDYEFLDELVKDYYSRQDKTTERQDKLSRREGQNDRTIPEITNIDYNTENTDSNLRIEQESNILKNKDFIYTSVPSEHEESAKENAIESAVSEVVADLGIEKSEVNDITEDITALIVTFGVLSTDKPRNITKAGLLKIIHEYLVPPENMDDADIEDYMVMMHEYFKTDFGTRGKYKCKITKSIEHFMSDGIRSLLYERCRQNE